MENRQQVISSIKREIIALQKRIAELQRRVQLKQSTGNSTWVFTDMPADFYEGVMAQVGKGATTRMAELKAVAFIAKADKNEARQVETAGLLEAQRAFEAKVQEYNRSHPEGYQCQSCGHEFSPAAKGVRCPRCGTHARRGIKAARKSEATEPTAGQIAWGQISKAVKIRIAAAKPLWSGDRVQFVVNPVVDGFVSLDYDPNSPKYKIEIIYDERRDTYIVNRWKLGQEAGPEQEWSCNDVYADDLDRIIDMMCEETPPAAKKRKLVQGLNEHPNTLPVNLRALVGILDKSDSEILTYLQTASSRWEFGTLMIAKTERGYLITPVNNDDAPLTGKYSHGFGNTPEAAVADLRGNLADELASVLADNELTRCECGAFKAVDEPCGAPQHAAWAAKQQGQANPVSPKESFVGRVNRGEINPDLKALLAVQVMPEATDPQVGSYPLPGDAGELVIESRTEGGYQALIQGRDGTQVTSRFEGLKGIEGSWATPQEAVDSLLTTTTSVLEEEFADQGATLVDWLASVPSRSASKANGHSDATDGDDATIQQLQGELDRLLGELEILRQQTEG